MNTLRIYIVGVGGQGNVLASKMIGEAALSMGVPVLMSETHGMAQRGGVVESTVVLGGRAEPHHFRQLRGHPAGLRADRSRARPEQGQCRHHRDHQHRACSAVHSRRFGGISPRSMSCLPACAPKWAA